MVGLVHVGGKASPFLQPKFRGSITFFYGFFKVGRDAYLSIPHFMINLNDKVQCLKTKVLFRNSSLEFIPVRVLCDIYSVWNSRVARPGKNADLFIYLFIFCHLLVNQIFALLKIIFHSNRLFNQNCLLSGFMSISSK